MKKYYILKGLNEDGELELIFGDYDKSTVQYEKEETRDFSNMQIVTLPNAAQSTIEKHFAETQ